MGFDQVRETKMNSSQMLQPCELYHVMLRNSLLYKTIVLLAREAFQPKNQVCSTVKKKLKLFDRKGYFQNRFSIYDVLYNL